MQTRNHVQPVARPAMTIKYAVELRQGDRVVGHGRVEWVTLTARDVTVTFAGGYTMPRKVAKFEWFASLEVVA